MFSGINIVIAYPIILIDVNSTVNKHSDNIGVPFTAGQWQCTLSPLGQEMWICALKKITVSIWIFLPAGFLTYKMYKVWNEAKMTACTNQVFPTDILTMSGIFGLYKLVKQLWEADVVNVYFVLTLCNRNSTTAICPWAAAHMSGVNPSSSCRFITDSEKQKEKMINNHTVVYVRALIIHHGHVKGM